MKEFKCPECGGKQLQEVMNNVITYTDIKITESGVDYGQIISDSGGEVIGYQCSECCYRVVDVNGDDVTDEDELFRLFK